MNTMEHNFQERYMMKRSKSLNNGIYSRVPHIHGDEPILLSLFSLFVMSSPYSWGWTVVCFPNIPLQVEFPIFMGMNRLMYSPRITIFRVPHIHGDEPAYNHKDELKKMSSPYSWGWTRKNDFSMFAGIRVPHIHGDEPLYSYHHLNMCMSSPYSWGWTASKVIVLPFTSEFPIFMGMNRPIDMWFHAAYGVPHIHGDEPKIACLYLYGGLSSPYSWGWTADMFATRISRKGVPHIHGDEP